METSKKRQEAIQEMRQKILRVAGDMFVREGYEDTTMRKIAKAIGCNPATIYNYFENKETIFFALQEGAFSRFYEEFDDLRNEESRGFEKLKRIGRKYIDFGLKHPDLYELMFILKAPMNAAESLDPAWKVGAKNYDLLKKVVGQCIEEQSINVNDVESGAFMIWSMLHGMISLMIMKHCQMMLEEDLDFIGKEAYLTFERMLKKQ